MSTTPYPIGGFSGIDWSRDPTEIGAAGATDGLNFDLDRAGKLRTRDGFTAVNASIGAGQLGSLWWSPTNHAIAELSGTTYAINGAGAAASTATFTPLGGYGYANIGTSTTSATYIVKSGGGSPGKWNGTAFSSPAFTGTSPTGTILLAWPFQARMVNLGLSANPSRVLFSNAGDPETFLANNFVDLNPGDGELFAGAVGWGEQLFCVKETRTFVFTGVATDSAGNPVFSYRPITNPFHGASIASIVAGSAGVYALTTAGLYATAGGPWTLVSDAIVPLLDGEVSGFSSPSIAKAGVGAGDRVIFHIAQGSTHYWLIWDERRAGWLLWSGPFQEVALGPGTSVFSAGFGLDLYTVSNAGTAVVMFFNTTSTTDAGTAIPWNYKTGLYSPAKDPSRVAISLESQLVGSGTATLQVATTGGAGSSNGALDTGSAVTMGTAPAIAEGWQQIDREGAWWQHKLSGTGSAAVTSLTHYLSFVKSSGVW